MNFNKKKRPENPHITLDGNVISVAPVVRYLGLYFDQRLTWARHIRHLRESCLSAMNLLKLLSHLEWGADRKTLEMMSNALIISKLKYGDQIYGSARPSILKGLDTIVNQCRRINSGAFRSSPIISIHVEAGSMPFSYMIDQDILKQLFKVRSSPDSPTFNCTTQEEWPQEAPSKLSPFMGKRAEALRNEYHIPNVPIRQIETPNIPPWKLPLITTCFSTTDKKSLTSEEQLRAVFSAHAEECHAHTTPVYTDGSKTRASVGYAAIFPQKTIKGRLHKFASIFTAELTAILLAIKEICSSQSNHSTNYTIYADSQSVLKTITNIYSSHPIVTEIHKWLYRTSVRKKNINFCWIPSHIGIAGNEKADNAAKAGAESPIIEKD